MMVQAVILCGGAGTRLWPLSRERHPKQLLSLNGDYTMLQATALRLDESVLPAGGRFARPIVVAHEEYRFMTAEQLREIAVRPAAIVLEPIGRNTAPALTIAAWTAVEQEREADPVLVVMPADHIIAQADAFRAAVAAALPLAAAGRVLTFGIVPTQPETGYGYIRRGSAIDDSPACEIAAFVEKPAQSVAEAYVASGEYLWNSGIFVVRASVWLAHIARLRPDIAASCRAAMAAGTRDHDFLRVDSTAFTACPSDSIDYAVMEKLVGMPDAPTAVLPLDAAWSDVGAWGALWEIGHKDSEGNVLHGDVVSIASHNTMVRAESRLVACVGLDDLVVVETADAVLVAHRDQLDHIRELVARLKREKRSECEAPRKIFRPWGCYDSVDSGHRFQVKRIVVNPGARLSLQMHHHRAEHWTVVVGTARVTRGDEQFLLSENESTYIPLGTVHRLENPGKVPLEIIEVQSGPYLGEDDIVRFEDTYGRDCGTQNVISLATVRAS